MHPLIQAVRRFLELEDGPTSVEYAVMLALIIVVCVSVIGTRGANSKKTFSTISTTLASSAS